MVQVRVAGFHHEDLAAGQREFRLVQPAAVGAALDQDQFVIRVPVDGILEVAFHAQTVENRQTPDARARLRQPASGGGNVP